jgi:hypothetical protein
MSTYPNPKMCSFPFPAPYPPSPPTHPPTHPPTCGVSVQLVVESGSCWYVKYILNTYSMSSQVKMWCNACRCIQIPRCVHFLSPHHTLPPHPPTHTHTQLFIMSSRTNKTLEQLCNHLVSHEAHPDSGHLTKSILMLWLLVLVGPITLSSFNHCDLFELCSLVILVLVR